MTNTPLIASALALALHGSASGQQLPKNAVPIFIYWSTAAGKAPLADASFEDEAVGQIPFEREADHFKGTRQTEGSWAFHDVTLRYGTETAPVALRTKAGVPSVRIAVALPTTNSCRLGALGRLRTVSESAPVPERISAMIEARHLLALRANTCPMWAQKDLAEIYFVMSCSLAKGTTYFRISEEAKTRLRQLARNPALAKVQIADCDTQALGVAVKDLRQTSLKTLSEGKFEDFDAINAELMAKSVDPAWAEAFSAQKVDKNLIRADQLKALYDQQKEAATRGNYEEAIQYNGRLTELLGDKDYQGAFELVKLNPSRLKEDRDYYETLKRPATESTPQE